MKRWPLVLITLYLAASANADSTFVSGTVGGVWAPTGNPYIVQGSLLLPADSSLEIQAGVRVEFQGQYIFDIVGRLSCLGVEGDSIYFTQDTVQFPLRWQGIRFRNLTELPTLSYMVVEFGGTFEGSIRVNNSEMTLNHSTIRNCVAQAFYPYGSNVTLTDCHFVNNGSPGACGGSMRSQNSIVALRNCHFERSYALDGAVLCVYGSDLTAYECTFDHNVGVIWGGVVYSESSNFVFRSCVFESNSAIMGAVTNINTQSTTEFDRCVFARNHAIRNQTEGSYGALYMSATGPHRISNCLFYQNVGQNSSAIYANGNVTIDQCVFVENSGTQIIGNSPDTVRYNAFHERPLGIFGMPSGFGVMTETNGNGDSTDTYGNLFTPPGFDPNGVYGEFSLRFDSHLRDAGDPNGEPDPDGTIPDLGPYPYYWLEAIDDLSMQRVGETSDLELRWSSIPEAAEYRIYRSFGGLFDPDAAYLVGLTDAPHFVHESALEVSWSPYTYIVIAYDQPLGLAGRIPRDVR